MSWLSGHWWWLLAGVGGLLLIGLLAPSARRWRRRRAVKRETRPSRVAATRPSPLTSHATEAVAQWSPEVDAELASTNLSDEHRPPRPRTVRLPSQPGSQWMASSRKSLVDELLEDEPESPDELSGFADFDRDVHEDLHEDLPRPTRTSTRIPMTWTLLRPEFRYRRAGDVRTGDVRAGRHAAAGGDDAQVTEAVPIPRIAPGQLAIHLPMDDPYQVPDGYPVKANASSGLYYMPDSALYEETMAEIWFASEEIAQANGFHRAG